MANGYGISKWQDAKQINKVLKIPKGKTYEYVAAAPWDLWQAQISA